MRSMCVHSCDAVCACTPSTVTRTKLISSPCGVSVISLYGATNVTNAYDAKRKLRALYARGERMHSRGHQIAAGIAPSARMVYITCHGAQSALHHECHARKITPCAQIFFSLKPVATPPGGIREHRAPTCVTVPGSSRVPLPPRSQLCIRHCSNKQQPPGTALCVYVRM